MGNCRRYLCRPLVRSCAPSAPLRWRAVYLSELIRVTRKNDDRATSRYTSTRPSVRPRAVGAGATRLSRVILSSLRPRPPYMSRRRSPSAAQRLQRSASTSSVATPLFQATRWRSNGEQADPQKSHTTGAAAERTSALRRRLRSRVVLAPRTISTVRCQRRSSPVRQARRSFLIWRLHEKRLSAVERRSSLGWYSSRRSAA
jgi:hypothetical protein